MKLPEKELLGQLPINAYCILQSDLLIVQIIKLLALIIGPVTQQIMNLK